MQQEEDQSAWHGTIIKIKKRPEIKVYKERITRLKKFLGVQYAHLIERDIVKIKINTEYVKPNADELVKDPKEAPDGK